VHDENKRARFRHGAGIYSYCRTSILAGHMAADSTILTSAIPCFYVDLIVSEYQHD
jgi:hypothetical protein